MVRASSEDTVAHTRHTVSPCARAGLTLSGQSDYQVYQVLQVSHVQPVSTVHAECHTSAHLTTHRYTGTWSVWGPLVSGHYLGNTHMTSYLPEEFYWHVNRDISFLVIYIHGFMCHLYFGW